MASLQSPLALSLLFMALCMFFVGHLAENRTDYIVYMGKLPNRSSYSPLDHHHSILQEALEEGLQSEQLLIRSYGRSFNGFAAKLTEKEQKKIAKMKGIISVFPSVTLNPQTTQSWNFMGFGEHVDRVPTIESDIIIGFLDTGIWPESESFSDKGYGPPPKKWKGVCNGGANFTCNNKIIGARYYSETDHGTEDSARDILGHGTHTASTAAGNQVNRVSLFSSLAEGNARGAVPLSRIAVYKVCWTDGCPTHLIMAAFDDAISDGVDIISASLGSSFPFEYNKDSIAIGAFHAMQHGILTSNSAGNKGPSPHSVSSVAPWMISVAASTTDRYFTNKVLLGDNTTITGNATINGLDLKGKMFPLITGYQAFDLTRCDIKTNRMCEDTCLVPEKLEGKILICENLQMDFDGGNSVIFMVGTGRGIGIIIAQEVPIDHAEIVPISNPKATIEKSVTMRHRANAPTVVSFSSRGPNSITPDILKPDISAPGVEILAAWPPIVPASHYFGEAKYVKYNILSGTSMSCPHVSGTAAYVKTFHPDWSPSAIKSALMTTALPMTATTNPDREFAYGAGHLNPLKAVQPGLVYEAFENDYVKMLCSIGYTSDMINLMVGNTSTTSCPPNYKGTVWDLNYPSMAMVVKEAQGKEATFTRTVTNVGLPNSTYKATTTFPSQLTVTVKPNVLFFKSLNEKQSFVVKVSARPSSQSVVSASVVWSDGIHNVRSPIVVYYANITNPNSTKN
ncbi:hypothetical protein Sjap_012740 [Stephania japonica]|uniref:Cucumisin n=1 Tax=Stephania japonica TaxID=461633 RepID=A0AAP0IYD4_9MAGN